MRYQNQYAIVAQAGPAYTELEDKGYRVVHGVGAEAGLIEDILYISDNGLGENSFEDVVLDLGRRYNQERVLIADCAGNANIVDVATGDTENIGRLVEVPEQEARRHGSWTEIFRRYYVAKR